MAGTLCLMTATPAQLWVATHVDFDSVATQVALTRDDAVHWCTTRISDHDWQAYYDALDDAERGTATRDRSGMTPEEVLTFYVGSDGPDFWGDGEYSFTVEAQTPYTAPTSRGAEQVGCDPDCQERTTCAKAGTPGHAQCGTCPCGNPRHHGCRDCGTTN